MDYGVVYTERYVPKVLHCWWCAGWGWIQREEILCEECWGKGILPIPYSEIGLENPVRDWTNREFSPTRIANEIQ